MGTGGRNQAISKKEIEAQMGMYEQIEECDRETRYKKIGRFLEFFNVSEKRKSARKLEMWAAGRSYVVGKTAEELIRNGYVGISEEVPDKAVLGDDMFFYWEE